MLLVAGFLIYRRLDENRPLFTYLSVEKTLTFRDEGPHTTSQSSLVEVQANHTGLTQLWFRSISADGPVTNFVIDGVPVPNTLILKKAGNYEVCKQFDRALRKGDTRKITFSYDMLDSFPNSREGTSHAAVTITKKLKIRIEFHPNKLGREVRWFFGGGGGLEQELPPPRTLNNGSVLEVEIQDLQVGGFYTIDWVW
jgi:hypothetical protein